jgi:hypothetical protein
MSAFTDDIEPGVIIANDEVYVHADDLVDHFNAKALSARAYLDDDGFDQWVRAAEEVADIVTRSQMS